ncbi:malonate decarboxylase holo-[acyl-carrier-protein] synthase [Agrobacterium rubi TR3 = NBRC 13261]|uniref:Malonate decarboxylase holo-[acyl-carrier-protein] synthase n=1 Tax=Agrobacterium rubi TR3 = NBRC 13261 TaxID=1368415 RepID=A0A081D2B5_9HYPH|nr:malonate decarboxylase holo-[acyl-carrier-protein] synthase [Agrobacterium rubi]MBP1880906.1 phosphoribosyl-dephospho-CoA transferase [Agrobacterium rubi]GAK73061.1 malonate decarboxylase holo-[acyl-carrier-protein] synthase [Agrobacterium rubi TR3 = NBRC 13261]
MTRPDRHRFVTLKPSWRDHAELAACSMAGGDILPEWIDAGRPLVVASSATGDARTTVRLGLSTPQKQRYGLRVPLDAIDTLLPPVTLDAAAGCAPSEWRASIDIILKVAQQHRLSLSVFGSLAWSYVSGESHLRPTSDLDLLVSAPAEIDILAAIRVLLDIESVPRLDGELVLSDGAGVNLREYAAQPGHILVKQHGGPQLVSLAKLMNHAGMAA